MGEADPLPALRKAGRRFGLRVVPVSAVTGAGLLDLKRVLLGMVGEARPERAAVAEGKAH